MVVFNCGTSDGVADGIDTTKQAKKFSEFIYLTYS